MHRKHLALSRRTGEPDRDRRQPMQRLRGLREDLRRLDHAAVFVDPQVRQAGGGDSADDRPCAVDYRGVEGVLHPIGGFEQQGDVGPGLARNQRRRIVHDLDHALMLRRPLAAEARDQLGEARGLDVGHYLSRRTWVSPLRMRLIVLWLTPKTSASSSWL